MQRAAAGPLINDGGGRRRKEEGEKEGNQISVGSILTPQEPRIESILFGLGVEKKICIFTIENQFRHHEL